MLENLNIIATTTESLRQTDVIVTERQKEVL